MNLARVCVADLRARAASTTLNLALLALGVATIVLVLLVSQQLEERLSRDAAGIDLVVGAKGSPMQIVLSSLYQLDAPTGTIPLDEARRLAGNLAVRTAIPIALADNYWGFRVVGTTPDYLAHYGAVPQRGRVWQAPFEAVIGDDVAARMHLTVGSTFAAAHGVRDTREIVHAAQPYHVVGVLAHTGTVVDRLVLTDVQSVAQIHAPSTAPDPEAPLEEPPDAANPPITAVLVQCVSTGEAAQLARQVNDAPELEAALPSIEIERIFRFIGVGRDIFWGFALVLMMSAGLSVFIALYNTLSEHRQELAIMRALGATPSKLIALLLLQGLALAAAGAAIGLLVGHAFTSAIGAALTRTHQVSITGWTWSPQELGVVALALGVGFLAAIVPAWRVRRIDIAATLARG